MPHSPDTSGTTRLRAGFTLLEMLVVVAIIALLASFIAPSVFRNVGDAKHTTAQAQLDAFSVALHAYQLDVGAYPSSEEGLQALRLTPPTTHASAAWRGPYVTKEIAVDPWKRPYVYVSPGLQNPASFDLYSLGRDGATGGEGEDADVTSWGGVVRP